MEWKEVRRSFNLLIRPNYDMPYMQKQSIKDNASARTISFVRMQKEAPNIWIEKRLAGGKVVRKQRR